MPLLLRRNLLSVQVPCIHVYLLNGGSLYTCFSDSPCLLHYQLRNHSCPGCQFYTHKRDIDLTPLVVGLGLLTGIGTGSARLGVPISQFQKLSTALKESLNDIALQISAIQDQIDSLTAVVLQNRKVGGLR
jgi:hypothetical protein